MRTPTVITAVLALSLALAACNPEADADQPGNVPEEQAFAAIGEGETIRLVGTEPFWGGEISYGTLTWSTPEDIDGQRVPVTRFAGRGGLSFSAQLDMRPLDIALTPASCSDGMSDRTYPYVATVQLGGQQLNG